jgi:hypothetical protein
VVFIVGLSCSVKASKRPKAGRLSRGSKGL